MIVAMTARACHDPAWLLAGDSPAVGRLRDQVTRVAGTPLTTVLVTGERGLGLEQVARAIHARSALSAGPFLFVDCVTLDSVDESAEAARGGSLFLHEVSALDLSVQDRLLAFLEKRADAQGVDFRLIASTACDLEERVERGLFREDLLYRLNVLTLRVPGLRERRADVPELVAQALRRAQRELGTTLHLHSDAIEALVSHSWTGNLLELETVVGIAALRASAGLITPEHLLLDRGPSEKPDKGVLEPALPPERSLRAVEEATIRRVLDEEQGNRSRAARVLGINRTTLYNKLRLYGID